MKFPTCTLDKYSVVIDKLSSVSLAVYDNHTLRQ